MKIVKPTRLRTEYLPFGGRHCNLRLWHHLHELAGRLDTRSLAGSNQAHEFRLLAWISRAKRDGPRLSEDGVDGE